MADSRADSMAGGWAEWRAGSMVDGKVVMTADWRAVDWVGPMVDLK